MTEAFNKFSNNVVDFIELTTRPRVLIWFGEYLTCCENIMLVDDEIGIPIDVIEERFRDFRLKLVEKYNE